MIALTQKLVIPEAVKMQFASVDEAEEVSKFLAEHKLDVEHQKRMRQQLAQYRAGSQPIVTATPTTPRAKTSQERLEWVKTSLYPANVFGIGNWLFSANKSQQKDWIFDAGNMGLQHANWGQSVTRLKKLERYNPRIKKGLEMAAQAVANGFYALLVVNASDAAQSVIEERIFQLAQQNHALEIVAQRRALATPELQDVLEGFVAFEYSEIPEFQPQDSRERVSAHDDHNRDEDEENTSLIVSIRDRYTGKELSKTFAYIPAVSDASPQSFCRLCFYLARKILAISGLGKLAYTACWMMAMGITAMQDDWDPLPTIGKMVNLVTAPANLIDYPLGKGQQRVLTVSNGVYIARGTSRGNEWFYCRGTLREALLTIAKMRRTRTK